MKIAEKDIQKRMALVALDAEKWHRLAAIDFLVDDESEPLSRDDAEEAVEFVMDFADKKQTTHFDSLWVALGGTITRGR